MVKFRRLAVPAAAAVIAASALMSGCSSKEDTAVESSSEAGGDESQSETDEEEGKEDTDGQDDEMAQVEADQEKISAISPSKPEDLGKVDSLTYKGISFEAEKQVEVTDADVETYLSGSILPNTPIDANDDEVRSGDTVNISYVGTMDGEEFEGGSADNFDLTIGSGRFIDGFEDGLIGAKYGETVVLDLNFPEDYGNEELNGKAVQFTVNINNISRTLTIDEFDDEAAKLIAGSDTVTADSYRQQIREFLQRNAELNFKSGLYNSAIAAAVEASSLEPSEENIDWQLDVALTNYDSNLQYQGLNLAYYLYMLGTDYDTFRADLRDQAEEAAKDVMLRYAVCEEEGLEYNDETLNRYLEEFGYTEEELDAMASEDEKQTAVVWYLAGQAIVDNGTVTYVDSLEEEADIAETEAEEPADEEDPAESEASAESEAEAAESEIASVVSDEAREE